MKRVGEIIGALFSVIGSIGGILYLLTLVSCNKPDDNCVVVEKLENRSDIPGQTGSHWYANDRYVVPYLVAKKLEVGDTYCPDGLNDHLE